MLEAMNRSPTGGPRAPRAPRPSRAGPLLGLLAVLACYGTLAAVALLSLVGIGVDLDEAVMAKLVTALLVLALLGMARSWRAHRRPGPLLLSLAAAALLVWVFFGRDSRALELTGFAALLLASVWDLRVTRRACPERRDGCADAGPEHGKPVD
jgi:arsenite methyltransferase